MPRRWCSAPSCTQLVTAPATRCERHELERRTVRAADRSRVAARRPSSSARGYDNTYRRNRDTVVTAALQASDAGAPIPCHLCQQPCERGQSLTAEHITPLRAGGTNELGNLAAAHHRCNSDWRAGNAFF